MINKYIKYIFSVALLFICAGAFAQSAAYHGGKGDGFAMAELSGAYVSIQHSNETDMQVWVYPNPIQQGSALHCRLPVAAAYNISITDLAGRCIYLRELNSQAMDIALDFKASAGTYILSIIYDGFKSNSLITVQ